MAIDNSKVRQIGERKHLCSDQPIDVRSSDPMYIAIASLTAACRQINAVLCAPIQRVTHSSEKVFLLSFLLSFCIRLLVRLDGRVRRG
jgi:hypothetical protein